jgi:hypothetical protein
MKKRQLNRDASKNTSTKVKATSLQLTRIWMEVNIRTNLAGLENRVYGRSYSSRWLRGTLCPQKLVLTSLTNVGRSVGIVRSRCQATEYCVPEEVKTDHLLTLSKKTLPGHFDLTCLGVCWSCEFSYIYIYIYIYICTGWLQKKWLKSNMYCLAMV